MSADPFANTTTVKNILQHIISPKIVRGASGGYVTKTDLVNVDNLIFNSPSTTQGTVEAPLTSQCGRVMPTVNSQEITIFHSRVTPNSIIFAVVQTEGGTFVTRVVPRNTEFDIWINTYVPSLSIGWFIASF